MKTLSPKILFGRSFFFAIAIAASANPNNSGLNNYLGPKFGPAQLKAATTAPSTAIDTITHWNRIAVDASGLDNTPDAAGGPRIFGEQLGPVRASRAMAIVHIAVFDAVNGVIGGCRS